MKISKVNIKDFKRFKDLTLDLGNKPAKIIALVGTNGCGKSSVLDAFIACGRNYSGNIERAVVYRKYSTEQTIRMRIN